MINLNFLLSSLHEIKLPEFLRVVWQKPKSSYRSADKDVLNILPIYWQFGIFCKPNVHGEDSWHIESDFAPCTKTWCWCSWSFNPMFCVQHCTVFFCNSSYDILFKRILFKQLFGSRYPLSNFKPWPTPWSRPFRHPIRNSNIFFVTKTFVTQHWLVVSDGENPPKILRCDLGVFFGNVLHQWHHQSVMVID